MKLYLMQHGHALSKEENPDRPLSEQGLQEVKKTSLFLLQSGAYFSDIWHSTKKRAQQTAEVIASTIQPQSSIHEKSGLAPQDNLDAVLNSITKRQEDLLIVGHLPQLDKLTSRLLGSNESAQIVQFQPSGVVCMQNNQTGKWSIAWMIIPELLSETV